VYQFVAATYGDFGLLLYRVLKGSPSNLTSS